MSGVLPRTSVLLIGSNVFMTSAWYAHLRNLAHRPWYLAAFASWGGASLCILGAVCFMFRGMRLA